jgi:O-antigen ligase
MSWLIIFCVAAASLLTVWGGNIPLAIIMGLTTLAGSVQLLRGRWQSASFPAPLSSCILLFTLWIGLSSLWSAAPFDTWRAFSVWALLPIWAWMLAGLPPRYLKKLLGAAAVVLYMLCLVAFWQVGQGSLNLPVYRPPSLFSNPNTFAALILILLLPLQYAWLAKADEVKDRTARALWAVILIVIFGALVLTVSRISLAAYLGITIIQLFLLRDAIKPEWKRFAVYFGALIVATLLLNMLTGNVVQARIGALSEGGGMFERMMVWDASWKAYLLQPLLGHGFGALFVPYAALRHREDGTYGQFAHSDILQYLAELGPLGLLLSAAIVGSFVWMSVSRVLAGFKNRNDGVWFVGASLAILACFGSALVTYIFYMPVILLCVAIMMGLWASLYWIDDEPLPIKSRPASAAIFFIGLSLMTGLHISAVMTDKAGTAISKRFSVEEHLYWNEWAQRLSFDLNPRVTMEWIDILLSQASLEKKPEQFAALEHMFAQMERLQPGLPGLWLQKARFNIARDRLIEAEADLQKALLLDPSFLPARLFLGRLYRETGRDDDTIADLYDEGLRWQLTGLKYGVVTMDALMESEDNMPRLLNTGGDALLPPATKTR